MNPEGPVAICKQIQIADSGFRTRFRSSELSLDRYQLSYADSVGKEEGETEEEKGGEQTRGERKTKQREKGDTGFMDKWQKCARQNLPECHKKNKEQPRKQTTYPDA